ncbi:hypothetical protein Y032_0466g1956 [Ancylostoma ceylanicum]|uniref:Uncharacterized protein n=1 Tax=Ancylostoma ceylanicum TaxID=53326 RepID=A0A016WZ06_9BILA|nr:hypothetical protein Y032_0466g1956 [Ancylostoma ceylanicum]
MHRSRGAAQQTDGGCRRRVFFGTTVGSSPFLSTNGLSSPQPPVTTSCSGLSTPKTILPASLILDTARSPRCVSSATLHRLAHVLYDKQYGDVAVLTSSWTSSNMQD